MEYPTCFLGLLYTKDIGYASGRLVRELTKPLIWVYGNKATFLDTGFQTDLASVPRVPIIYSIWGDRAHREAANHDYDYRTDAVIYELKEEAILDELRSCITRTEFEKYVKDGTSPVPKPDGDGYFKAAMIGRVQPWYIYHPMYLAVRFGGGSSYHRMSSTDRFPLDKNC